MTVNRGPGVTPIAGVGTTTLEHRLQLAGQYAENAPGVPRSGVLAQATDQLVIAKADWSYDILTAALVIGRTAGEGVYTPTLTGTTNVATDAAPASNSRWDLIYIKQNDQAKGDADNAAVIGVIKGTPLASPSKPTGSLPAGAYVLAEARIFATTTGTSGGSNTIAQVWRHTAARGAPIPVRNDAERAEITSPAVGQQAPRLDLKGSTDIWSGTAWERDTEFSNWITTDTNWIYGGGLVRTVINGKTFIRLTGVMYRQAGGSFTVNVGTDVVMGVYIPANWRPPALPASALAPVMTGTTHNGEPLAMVDTDGKIKLHATVAPVTVAVGAHISFNMGWYL